MSVARVSVSSGNWHIAAAVQRSCGCVSGQNRGRKSMGAAVSEMKDNFYVGYQPKAAPAIRTSIRRTIFVLALLHRRRRVGVRASPIRREQF